MFETIKDIVVAMIENDYISKTNDNNQNIENVNIAIKNIAKQLDDVNHSKFD